MEDEKSTTSKRGATGKTLVGTAWIFLILNMLVIIGNLSFGNHRSRAIKVLLSSQSSYETGRAIGYLAGANVLALAAFALGFTAYRRDKKGKKTIITVIIIIILNILSVGMPKNMTADKEELLVLPTYKYANESSTDSKFPEYISEEHGFQVRFPTKVRVINYEMLTTYAAEIAGEGVYSISVNSFPKVWTGKDIQAVLEGYLEGRLDSLDGKPNLIQSQQVLFLGYRALDYEYTCVISGNVMYFKGIYFVAGKLGYGISVACAKETKTTAYSKYNDFIRSFRLIKSIEK